MSEILSQYGTYLQDFISRAKSISATNMLEDINGTKVRKGNMIPEQSRELVKNIDAVGERIRKSENILGLMDTYSAVLPIVINSINEHEKEDPPLAFVLKRLVVASVMSCISLMDLYYKVFYRIANIEHNNVYKERFNDFRLVDYVRIMQITAWFSPVRPVFTPSPKKVYQVLEPMLKSVETDSLYGTLESRLQKLSIFWRSQAERDILYQGRDIPG